MRGSISNRSTSKCWLLALLAACLIVPTGTFTFADDANADAAKAASIQKEHQLLKGTWQVVELVVNGEKAWEGDARKLMVVNGNDGSWALYSEEMPVSKGASTIDPLQDPKTIDFEITEGESAGKQFHGIYELGENQRKVILVSADLPRPTSFESFLGKQEILMRFERDQSR